MDSAGVSKKVGFKDPAQRKRLPINRIITNIDNRFTQAILQAVVMKKLTKITIVLGFAFLFGCSTAWSSELIKPTRALDSAGEKPGKLSVFSEPPGLEVALEGTLIGKTPLFLDEVSPGSHRLQIKNSETDITIEPGKTLKISLYNDKFILIPATDKKPPEQSQTAETSPNKSKPPPPPVEEQRPKELSPIERFRLLGHY
jgi:hypothetical protein